MIKMLREIIDRFKYWKFVDRIGPDIPTQHWKLYFKSTMVKYCKLKFLKFTEDSEVRPGVYVFYPSKISIGSRVIVRPGTVLAADEHANIIISDNVMLGMGIHIYVNNHKYGDITKPVIDQGYFPSKNVVIKEGAWIGANSIILPGVEIGENTVIGAGSVVTKSFPKGIVAAGNPAIIIRTLSNQ